MVPLRPDTTMAAGTVPAALCRQHMADSSASVRSDPAPPAGHRRRLPVGVELVDDRLAHARVWAPRAGGVEIVLDSGRARALEPDGDGYFAGTFEAVAGDRYCFKLGHDSKLYPDPASRFQPDGPHGSSAIVDPHAFGWTDAAWRGAPLEGQVVYEMHVGTFTREGTLAAAANELRELANIGVTIIELMPVAEFDGR